MTSEDQQKPHLHKGPSSFLGNVLTLSRGEALAQLVAILAAPLIARLFAPDAFGLAAVFASIVAILSPLGCLRLDLAVMLPHRDEHAANLLSLCLLLLAIATVVLGLVVASVGDPLFSLMRSDALAPYGWLIPAGFFWVALLDPLRAWYSRHKRFSQIAGASVASAVSGNGASLVVGALGFVSAPHLIVARLLGSVIRAAVLLVQFVTHDFWFVFIHTTRHRLLWGLRRYRRFPLISTWVALQSTISRYLPAIVLASYFGPASAGFFSLARRIALLPSHLIGASTTQVFFQRASEMKAADQDLSHLFTLSLQRLVAVGLLPAMLLMLAGPELFAFVFSETWLNSGAYAAALAPWIFTNFVTAPIRPLFSILERQHLELMMTTAISLARLAALMYGGAISSSALQALHLYALVGVIFDGVTIVVLGNMVGAQWWIAVQGLLRCFLGATLAGGLLAFLVAGWSSPPVVLFAAGASALVYISVLVVCDSALREVIIRGWVGRFTRR